MRRRSATLPSRVSRRNDAEARERDDRGFRLVYELNLSAANGSQKILHTLDSTSACGSCRTRGVTPVLIALMPRSDLLALTPEDLTALTNRGTVKRAQREIEAGEPTVEIQETEDGTILAKWSDGVHCLVPGKGVVADSRCSCPATELCRHVIRTVLAYQQKATESAPAAGPERWNPGDIADDELAKHFKPAVLTQAGTQFHGGLLIEVVKSAKPTARFHDLACTLRFQVPGDVRYIHCDCAADPPCIHVPLAVWAFRQVPAGTDAALVSTQTQPSPVPAAVLDSIEQVLLEGVELGLSGAGTPWRDRLARLEAECRTAGLVWPAEVILELIHQFERYSEHDAAFSPERFAELVGELTIRSDAIRSGTGAVPQLLIRGSASDKWTDLAGSRFIGLGCGVQPGRKRAALTAFFQDANSGSVVAVRREFPDPTEPSDSPKEYWQLAQTAIVKGATFAQVGAGQLLTQGGKRATNRELVLGRAKAAVNPQGYAWENLHAPVFAEAFAEVRERLRLLPPSSLRPRRVGEDFHVCPVARIENAAFLPHMQAIEAVLSDSRGDRLLLRHPFTSRGREGSERLLRVLLDEATQTWFVAGPMRIDADGLVVEPVALVVQGDSARVVIQPWIDREAGSAGSSSTEEIGAAAIDPLEDLLRDLQSALGDLLLIGLRRSDARVLRSWEALQSRAEGVGFSALGTAIEGIVQGLREKAVTVQWSAAPTAARVLESSMMSRMIRDVA